MKKIEFNLLAQALDLNPSGILLIDAGNAQQTVLHVNPALTLLSGYEQADAVGKPLRTLILNAADMDAAENSSGGDEELPQVVHFRCSGAGSEKGASVPLDLTPLFDTHGKVAYWLGVQQDTESSAIDSSTVTSDLTQPSIPIEVFSRSIGSDTVASLISGAAFDSFLHRDWALARRDQKSMGLICFTIDSFPEYLDVFGRHAGQACLRKVGHAITGALRRTGDLCACSDDGEFLVLIGNTTEEQAAAVANRVASKVRELAVHHPRSGVARFVTVSYGVAAEVPVGGKAPADFVDEARQKARPREISSSRPGVA